MDRQTFDINIKIEYYNNTKELTDRRLALLELNVIKNNRPNFAGWGGYFFVFLSESITTSVITSTNTNVYVRRSEKDTTPITSLLKEGYRLTAYREW